MNLEVEVLVVDKVRKKNRAAVFFFIFFLKNPEYELSDLSLRVKCFTVQKVSIVPFQWALSAF